MLFLLIVLLETYFKKIFMILVIFLPGNKISYNFFYFIFFKIIISIRGYVKSRGLSL